MKRALLELARQILPVTTRRKIVQLTRWPPVGLVNFGSFGRLKPISASWGMERGNPIDRYYIENYLATHVKDIYGHVLEIGSNTYTRRFGRAQVTKSDVLHILEQKPNVTIIGSLESAGDIPSNSFDCIILTQTLQLIFDVPAALSTVNRILKPGGTTLVTVPGIAQISRYDMDRWGDYWRFTTKSMRRLFEHCFPKENIEIQAYGNVLASIAFLEGLSAGELRRKALDTVDPDYELLITVRATKPNNSFTDGS
jgi:SAM-dependent methyltransferase